MTDYYNNLDFLNPISYSLSGLFQYFFSWFNPLYISYFQIIWGILSLILALLVAYMVYQVVKIRLDHFDELKNILIDTWHRKSDVNANPEWDRVKKSLESDNSADWKVAIIEADNILDALVAKMGYPGGNLGERLKMVEPSDFKTLNEAWEAHKVRNTIAHEAGYELTKREAQTVISLYEKVFREFGFI